MKKSEIEAMLLELKLLKIKLPLIFEGLIKLK